MRALSLGGFTAEKVSQYHPSDSRIARAYARGGVPSWNTDSVRRINPNKLRQFARARGVLAKNDRLDARLIAEYVAIMPTRVEGSQRS